MIKVVIKRDRAGSIRSLDISGHAGYAAAGSDIICSAVSAIAYTAAGSLGELAGLERCFCEEEGRMTISLPDGMTERRELTAAIIMETAAIGLKQVELAYGKYVKVLEEEV